MDLMDIRYDSWRGNDIRFVNVNGECIDEFSPEELAEEIYLRAYRKFGGQC